MFFLLLSLFILFSYFCAKYILKNKNSKKSSIILLVWSVLLSLMFLEAYYRFIYMKSAGVAILGDNFAKKYYKEDKWGFRDSLLPLSLQKSNIIILGDSFVYGHAFKSPEARYSNMLRGMLEDFHVVNMSESGASTNDEILFLLKHRRRKAKTSLIVLNYVFNDIESSIPPDGGGGHYRPPKILRKIFGYIVFLKHMYYNFIYPVEAVNERYFTMLREAYSNEEILQDHILQLKLLKYVTEEIYDSKLLIVVWPWLDKIYYSKDYKRMIKEFEGLGISYIDLVLYLKKYKREDLMLSPKDPHPSEKANKVLTEIIYRYIEDNLEQ